MGKEISMLVLIYCTYIHVWNISTKVIRNVEIIQTQTKLTTLKLTLNINTDTIISFWMKIDCKIIFTEKNRY